MQYYSKIRAVRETDEGTDLLVGVVQCQRSGVMGKNKKVKFTTNINEELLKKIKIKAIEEEKNVNEIIEKLLQEYLKGE